jgi:hypothetical protein
MKSNNYIGTHTTNYWWWHTFDIRIVGAVSFVT